jgi:antitoxin VapB
MNAPTRSFKVAVTRAFKSGNSQAVRIPAELAYDKTDMELTITRNGDVITISPKRPSMEETIAALRALPDIPLIEEHDRIELPERDWDRQ